MTCTVVDCDQYSPAWWAARAGLLTASDAADILAKPRRGDDETLGKASLRLRLALERLRGGPLYLSRFVSDDMRRGIAREADAVMAYEVRTGELVRSVGFLRHDILPIGCSPDGVVGEGGLEVKCPKYTTHYGYLRQGVLPSEYMPQLLHSLLVSGAPWWDFASYCPEFPGAAQLFTMRLWRHDVDLAAYELAVRLFLNEVDDAMNTIRALCAPETQHAA